jgi:hypothetical protein
LRTCHNGRVRRALRTVLDFLRRVFGPLLRYLRRFFRWAFGPVARAILRIPFVRRSYARRLLDTLENAPEHTLAPELKQLKAHLATVPRPRRLAMLEEVLANPERAQAQQQVVASSRALRRASRRKGGPPQQFQRRGRMR